MKVSNQKTRIKNKKTTGRGILNSVINNLPFEMHIPGYRFCGPGTKLDKRLKAGQRGINKLDDVCRLHDIAYESPKLTDRKKADDLLSKEAIERVRAKDASIGEKIAALSVAGLMKAKSAIGGGLKRKMKRNKKKPVKMNGKILRTAIRSAKDELIKQSPKTMQDAVRIAITAAKTSIKDHPKPSNIQRVIPVPKIGGVLPLIPIFAGLSALGSLVGGSAAVANAVITANNAKRQLKESSRHNETMEAIALGRNSRGEGVYLKPFKTGLGLYTQKKNSKNF